MNDKEMNQLDRRMAIKVTGWDEKDKHIWGDSWNPTDNATDAMDVLKRLIEHHGLYIEIGGEGGMYELRSGTIEQPTIKATAPTLELAICLFADGVRG